MSQNVNVILHNIPVALATLYYGIVKCQNILYTENMYELIKITDNNYYINCPTKPGVYDMGGGHVWLIDGGSDKDAARKISKIILERDWTLEGIIVTHSHADHIGGCRLLRDRSGCTVYAAAPEAAVTEHPHLEPAMLYGGYPPKALRGKFLMAQQSCECEPLDRDKPPVDVKIIPLPGHCLDMIGVLTPEGVFYCADAVFPAHVVEKYHVNFVYDVAACMETLKSLPNVAARYYLPAHAPEPLTDISELAALNLSKMLEIIGLILDICAEPNSFEEILRRVFGHYSLSMDFAQYALVGSSVRSYLAYLLDTGALATAFEHNKMLWSAAK